MDLFDCVRFTPYFKEVVVPFLCKEAVYYCICLSYANCSMLGVSSHVITVSSLAAVLRHTTNLGSFDAILEAILVDVSDPAVIECSELLYNKLKDINFFQPAQPDAALPDAALPDAALPDAALPETEAPMEADVQTN